VISPFGKTLLLPFPVETKIEGQIELEDAVVLEAEVVG
jgi:hypothetical protein